MDNLSLHQHTLGVRSDLDIANLKLVADIKKFPLSGGILRKGISAGPQGGRLTEEIYRPRLAARSPTPLAPTSAVSPLLATYDTASPAKTN